MADDDRPDAALLDESRERAEVLRESIPRQPPLRLRRQAEGIGERETDADAPEVDPQDPRAVFRQCPPAAGATATGFTAPAGFVSPGSPVFPLTAATAAAIALSSG